MRFATAGIVATVVLLEGWGGWRARSVYESLFDRTMECNEIYPFSVKELAKRPRAEIEISGLSGNSSMAESGVTLSTQDDKITVFVHFTMYVAGRSGSFSYGLKIPDNINKVGFGNRGTIIWQR